jgi:hypothetical protein
MSSREPFATLAASLVVRSPYTQAIWMGVSFEPLAKGIQRGVAQAPEISP